MVQKEDKTYEATLALLQRSRNNVKVVEDYLVKKGKASTPKIANSLGWTTNKTNSIIYKMKKEGIIDYNYEIVNGRTVKEVFLSPLDTYLK